MTHHLLEKKKSNPKPESIRRALAIGVVALMLQGTSSELTATWAAGCVENPDICVNSTADSGANTLRSAVAAANLAGGTKTIGFADELFGITRDATTGAATLVPVVVEENQPARLVDIQNPVVITLGSTLEIRSDLTIRAPYVSSETPQILKIARGAGMDSGAPLIAVNPTVLLLVPAGVGATAQVTIENVIIDSNANPNSGGDPRSTPGVAIEVKSTINPQNQVESTPDLVVKNSQILNGVSESGGAAINTPGNVVVENSLLTDNMAITPDGGAASDGGAILAGGNVTVLRSGLNNNSATGNGGAIAANSVVIAGSETGNISQLNSNTASGNGGAIAVTGSIEVREEYVEIQANVAGGNGGALSAGATVTIGNEVSIIDNHAGQTRNGSGRQPSSSGGNGGAISAGGAVTVTNTELSNNTAQGIHVDDGPASGSGGAIASDGAVIVRGSVLNDNWASGVGGAIYGDTVTVESALSNHIIADHVVNSEISGNYSAVNGGAIFADGPVSVNAESQNEEYQTEFLENQTGGSGGAIFSESSVVLDNVRLSGGRALGSGGGIYSSGTIAVSNSVLRENVAGSLGDIGEPVEASELGANGGAIFSENRVTVTTSLFESNRALADPEDGWQGHGGGIFSLGEVSTLESIFRGNTAGGSGGAIWSSGQAFNSESTTITYNFAGRDGGGIYTEAGTVQVSNSQLDANIAGEDWGGNGGAIFGSDTVTVINSSFESNTAVMAWDGWGGPEEFGDGGAIYAGSTLEITDSTFKANYADGNGGAIFANGSTSITGSVFASITIDNPDYNPTIGQRPNPDYDSTTVNSEKIENPNYNPLIDNVRYNVSVPRYVPNPDYTEFEVLIPNPLCVGDYLEWDGQCFFMDQERPEGGPVRYELQIWFGDTRVEIPNELYVDLRFVLDDPNAPLDWRQLIDNPNFGAPEFIDKCAFEGPCDNREEIILGNTSDGSGGAIYALGSISIDQSEFSYNSSSGDGGAIGLDEDSTITILDSIFERNSAGYDGGAIGLDEDSTITILDSTFERNSAGDDGGAIGLDEDSTITILDSIFERNSAGDDGGAINLDEDSTITILDSIFERNSAGDEGGAIDEGTMRIARTTFLENSSGDDGGALWISDLGQSVILNSIFSSNTAGEFGGAIYGPAWIMFSDFVDNRAASSSAISLTGRLGTMLVGNILKASSDSEATLCNISFWNTPDNIATDNSCFSETNQTRDFFAPSLSLISSDPINLKDSLNIRGANYTDEISDGSNCPLISCLTSEQFLELLWYSLAAELDEYTGSDEFLNFQESLADGVNVEDSLDEFNPTIDDGSGYSFCLLSLNDYYEECLAFIQSENHQLSLSFSNTSTDRENMDNLQDLIAGTGDFLRQNFIFDHDGRSRLNSDFWTVGALQSFVEDLPVIPEERRENAISAAEPALRAAEPALRAAERALRAAEDAKGAAELAAAKLAKKEAAAKRAAERKSKLMKVIQKLAATKARGAALKQKIEWINLMKHFVAQ